MEEQLTDQERSSGYRRIIEALEEKPRFELPDSFAKNVMGAIALKEEVAHRKYLLLVGAAVFSFLALGFAGLVYFMGWEGISNIRTTLIYALITAFFVAAIQYADQVFVKRRLGFS